MSDDDKRKEYERLSNKITKAVNNFKNFREKILKEGCTHFVTYSYTYDSDNGYGKWWSNTITRCKICDKEL